MQFSMLLINAAFLAVTPALGTTVRKVNSRPTGYVVDFIFKPNATEHHTLVLLGGFALYSDALHGSPFITNGYSPYNWKPDYFRIILFNGLGCPATLGGLNMTYNPSARV